MGVKDLWQLLAPIGRRVSIETLEGKILAIDASVWIIQFIKALRDEDGHLQKNAHIVGTLRRILKLLYHKIKPVFVFDGATPTLKIRTVKARNEKKTGYERDQKLVAQRILLSQIKQNIIKSKLAKTKEIKQAVEGKFAAGFNNPATLLVDSNESLINDSKDSSSKDILSSTSTMMKDCPTHYHHYNQPPDDSMVDEIEWQEGYENLHHKDTMTRQVQKLDHTTSITTSSSNSSNNNNNNQYGGNQMYSANGDNVDSDTESLEWDLPEHSEDIDINVLASIPCHMRKELIESARRKERIRSRNNYIPAAGDPSLYSQTQIANFLKTSRLNKRIEIAQKLVEQQDSLGGKRIASDGSKKYIFYDKNTISTRSEKSSNMFEKQYPKSTEYDWLDEVYETDAAVSDKKIIKNSISNNNSSSSYGNSYGNSNGNNNEITMHVDNDYELNGYNSEDDSVSNTHSTRMKPLNRLKSHKNEDTTTTITNLESRPHTAAHMAEMNKNSNKTSIVDLLNEDDNNDSDDEGINGGGFLIKDDSTATEGGGGGFLTEYDYIIEGGGFLTEDDNAVSGGGGFLRHDDNIRGHEHSKNTEQVSSTFSPSIDNNNKLESNQPISSHIISFSNKKSFKNDISSKKVRFQEDFIVTSQESIHTSAASVQNKQLMNADINEEIHNENNTASSSSSSKSDKVVLNTDMDDIIWESDDNDSMSAENDTDIGSMGPSYRINTVDVSSAKLYNTDDNLDSFPLPTKHATSNMLHSPPNTLTSNPLSTSTNLNNTTTTTTTTTSVSDPYTFQAYMNQHYPTENMNQLQGKLSQEVAERAVNMASGMADWAGRAVQRVLKQHLGSKTHMMNSQGTYTNGASASTSSSISQSYENLIDQKPPITSGSYSSIINNNESASESNTVFSTNSSHQHRIKDEYNHLSIPSQSTPSTTVSSTANIDIKHIYNKAEDVSPTTHPIHPQSAYIEANKIHDLTTIDETTIHNMAQQLDPILYQDLLYIDDKKDDIYVINDNENKEEMINDGNDSHVHLESRDEKQYVSESSLVIASSSVTASQYHDNTNIITNISNDKYVNNNDNIHVDKADSNNIFSSTTIHQELSSLHSSTLTNDQLQSILQEEELFESIARRARAVNLRDAEGMTEEMKEDVISLLKIFEIPYIIAPYEAEAQCAVLEQLKLVDGVVTEDSDAFLFGASHVYRNIFSDKKYVEVYLASDAEKEIGLSREDFIALAFFLGSDYTEGITGIGIVNSIEIIHTFTMKYQHDSSPYLGLSRFKEWVHSFDPVECIESYYKTKKNKHTYDTNNTSTNNNNNITTTTKVTTKTSKTNKVTMTKSKVNKHKKRKFEKTSKQTISPKMQSKRPKRMSNHNTSSNKDTKDDNDSIEDSQCSHDSDNNHLSDHDALSDDGDDGDDDEDSNYTESSQQQEDDDDDDDDNDNSSHSTDNSDKSDSDSDISIFDNMGNRAIHSKKTSNNKYNVDKSQVVIDLSTNTVNDDAAAAAADRMTINTNTTSNNKDVHLSIQEIDHEKLKLIEFTEKHRSGRMNWKIPSSFPDIKVIDAYLYPAASYDKTAFIWPLPKSHRIRKYCTEVLGWTDAQMDATIDPVIRKLMDKTTQTRIDSHFMSYQDNNRFARVASTRLSQAVTQITGKNILPITRTKSTPTTATATTTTTRKGKRKGKNEGINNDIVSKSNNDVGLTIDDVRKCNNNEGVTKIIESPLAGMNKNTRVSKKSVSKSKSNSDSTTATSVAATTTTTTTTPPFRNSADKSSDINDITVKTTTNNSSSSSLAIDYNALLNEDNGNNNTSGNTEKPKKGKNTRKNKRAYYKMDVQSILNTTS